MAPKMGPGSVPSGVAPAGGRNQKNLGKRNVWGLSGLGPNGSHRGPLEQISRGPFWGGFGGSFGAVLGSLGRSFWGPRASILDPLWGAVLHPGPQSRRCILALNPRSESRL